MNFLEFGGEWILHSMNVTCFLFVCSSMKPYEVERMISALLSSHLGYSMSIRVQKPKRLISTLVGASQFVSREEA